MARNPRTGAMGLMQVMPGTAKSPGFGVAPLTNPWDAEANKRFGTDYFNAMANRYGGDEEAALAAYNWGPGNADKWVAGGKDRSMLPEETRNYLGKILGRPQGGDTLASALGAPQTVPGGGPVPLTPENLSPPSGRNSKLAEMLLASAAGARPQGWGDLLNAGGDLALGYSLSNKADNAQNQYQSRLAQALSGAGDRDALVNTLMQSGDPDLMKTAIAEKLKPPAVPPRETVSPGQIVIDPNTGEEIYAAPQKPSTGKRFKAFEGGGVFDEQEGVWIIEPPKKGAPMNATSMKEIFESDESAAAAENVLSSLNRALELNEQAYSGPGAKTRGYLTSLYGSEGGIATEELQNVVTSQVLENLKATFGGMPTEGERQVLLDVQGSVDKSPEVRKRIFERAMETAQRRLDYNKQKAEGIRSGSYFQPGGGNIQGAPQSEQPSPFPEYPNARQAPDGNWYIENPDSPGSFLRIDQ